MDKNDHLPQPPESPFAKHRGVLLLGGHELDCYVLDTVDRVLNFRSTVRAISGKETGSLESYIGIEGLQEYISSKQILEGAVDFHIPGTQFTGKGILAETFIEICRAYAMALADEKLKTPRQIETAARASLLLAACSKLGIIALIDEATGYQYEREADALQIKLAAYVSEELREWEKTFPDELWEEFGRLTNWSKPLHSRPKWWGSLVLELIYEALDKDVAQHLRKNKPPPRHGQNYHQWLTQDIGLRHLITHIHQVIGIAKTCESIAELKDKVRQYYNLEPVQLTLTMPRPELGKGQVPSLPRPR